MRRMGWIAAGLLLGTVEHGCAVGGDGPGDGPMLGEDSGSTAGGPSSATSQGPGGGPGADPGSGPGGDPDGSDAPDDSTNTTPPGTTGCDAPTPWYPDEDGDGFGQSTGRVIACEAPAGHVGDDTDCDDEDDQVYPGAPEPCGGPDTNCDFSPPPLCNSCLQLQVDTGADEDGLYTIDPDGEGEPLPPTQVWCDMNTDGGGWTLVQRTVWAPAQTSALRTGYADWYTLTLGNPSPGQGFRLQGSAWESLNLQLDHMLVHRLRRESDGGSCEPLFYIGVGGTLTVTETETLLTGLTADVNMTNGTELSTLDSGPSSSCVMGGTAVPWFYGSCCSTCPSYQGGYWGEPHPMEPYSDDTPDAFGQTNVDVCTSPAQGAMTGPYWGVNEMEYYLR